MNLQFFKVFIDRGKENKEEFCCFVSTPFLLSFIPSSASIILYNSTAAISCSKERCD